MKAIETPSRGKVGSARSRDASTVTSERFPSQNTIQPFSTRRITVAGSHSSACGSASGAPMSIAAGLAAAEAAPSAFLWWCLGFALERGVPERGVPVAPLPREDARGVPFASPFNTFRCDASAFVVRCDS